MDLTSFEFSLQAFLMFNLGLEAEYEIVFKRLSPLLFQTLCSFWHCVYCTVVLPFAVFDNFVRYTLLVLDWTHFCLQIYFNSSWHKFNNVHSPVISVHSDMVASCSCCKFVASTTIIQSSHSTTSQRGSIGLRCGGSRGYWSTESCSTKPVWDDICFVTWSVIQLKVAIRRWAHGGHKEMYMDSNNTQVGCDVKTMLRRGTDVCQENIPHTILPQATVWIAKRRQDGSKLTCRLHQILTIPYKCRSRNQD